MRRTRLLKHLRQSGCSLILEGSRHSWWGNADNNRRTAVPRHSEISEQLANKICQDLGIARLV